MEDLDARQGFKPPHTDDADARHYAVRGPSKKFRSAFASQSRSVESLAHMTWARIAEGWTLRKKRAPHFRSAIDRSADTVKTKPCAGRFVSSRSLRLLRL